ncbi:MAG: sigma-70 family RNA polymerase sigma factor [Gemmatimonadaceae bacterium]
MSSSDPKTLKDRQFVDEALRCLPEVARYALSLARRESDADDLVQETFLRAYTAWPSYEVGTECRGWLFTICRNVFLRSRKHDQRQVACEDAELESLAAAALHASATQSGLGDLFTRIDLAPALERALLDLPETFRDVVTLVDIQDESYAVASEVLEVPVGTIRSRLFRGRRLLQKSLLEYARDAGLARTAGDSFDPEVTT